MEDSVMDDSKGVSQHSATDVTTTHRDTPDANLQVAGYQVNGEVVITDLGDELVVMAPASGKMFSLNSSGRTLWQRLPATAVELADALCDAFEVSREDALADSQAWLEALVEAGLIEVQPRN